MPREPLVRGALEDAAIQQTDQLLDGVWRGGGGYRLWLCPCAAALKKFASIPLTKVRSHDLNLA